MPSTHSANRRIKRGKLHIHYRGKQRYNYGGPADWQTDNEWHIRLKKPSVWATVPEIVHSLEEYTVQDLEIKYHFDKNASTEYLKIEARPVDDINVQLVLDIFSCWCTEDWESEGEPPF